MKPFRTALTTLFLALITSPGFAQNANKEIDRKFGTCISKAADNPDYRSTDGGKSARKMLEQDCPAAYIAWVDSCIATGDTKNSCVLKAAIAAQAALKLAGR